VYVQLCVCVGVCVCVCECVCVCVCVYVFFVIEGYGKQSRPSIQRLGSKDPRPRIQCLGFNALGPMPWNQGLMSRAIGTRPYTPPPKKKNL